MASNKGDENENVHLSEYCFFTSSDGVRATTATTPGAAT
jgi:hypothetical protein